MKRLFFVGSVAAALLLGATGTATADPVRHFDNFRILCGTDVYELVSKPCSSNVVTINGVTTNSVSILFGLKVTVDGVVVFEFHKPYTQNHDVVICHEIDPGPGIEVVAETVFTPRR